MRILEDGEAPKTEILRTVFYELDTRKVDWFSVEDGVIIIKLKRKE